MANVTVSLKLNEAQLNKLPAKLRQKAEEAVNISAHEMEATATKKVRDMGAVKSGNLANSAVVNLSGAGLQRQAEIVFRAGYSLFVHNGTGLFGPRKDFIRPKSGQFLSWIDPQTGERRFAKKVRGMKGKPFLSEAMEEERPEFQRRVLG